MLMRGRAGTTKRTEPSTLVQESKPKIKMSVFEDDDGAETEAKAEGALPN